MSQTNKIVQTVHTYIWQNHIHIYKFTIWPCFLGYVSNCKIFSVNALPQLHVHVPLASVTLHQTATIHYNKSHTYHILGISVRC